MATGTIVPVEEYLRTTYEPDCDFSDGELIERHVGEYPHSRLQGLLYAYFLRRRKKWSVTPILEQRIQVRENKFLIPDICVLLGPEPKTRVLTEPPFIWIEVLSSQDRPIRVNRKVKDAVEFGAAYVWVVDPQTLESYVATKDAQYEIPDGVFRIPSMDLAVPLAELDED
jgi:Uma2 family endonuclease